jgi:ABC-type cobalamin/Fe3+-siderophores transport system ATPase subunit
MFEQLNLRTRRIITRLCARKEARIGGTRIGPLGEKERLILATIASEVRHLGPLGGRDLTQAYKETRQKISAETLPPDETTPETIGSRNARGPCKLGKVLCCSFRGLAPAGRVWEHDFAGKSHLLHGPNGCGKSSLLGAISWCLTGRIYRDDQPPDKPALVKVYSEDGSKWKGTERPDALSLMDKGGLNTKEDREYWVRIQLLSQDGSSVWVERHSVQGLRKSDDGQSWTSMADLDEMGLEELDAELHLLMPARLGHLHFGKDETVTHILSQLVGLDDLLQVADTATRLATQLRNEATKLEKDQLRPQKAKTDEHIAQLKAEANDAIKGMTHYDEVIGERRNLETVRGFGVAVAQAIADGNKKLAEDLGIVPPQENSPDARAFELRAYLSRPAARYVMKAQTR